MKIISHWIAASALLANAAPGFAHMVLDEPVARAGSSYKAVLRVGHGCAGSPTTAVKVQIPAGLRGAKPMPKAGWVVATRLEKLAQPYVSHGKQITEDVVEISWTAASRETWLPDAFFDEFVLRGNLPEKPGPMWFKVLQSCETGSNDWSQLPASGSSTKGLKSPAVLLEIIPSGQAAHPH